MIFLGNDLWNFVLEVFLFCFFFLYYYYYFFFFKRRRLRQHAKRAARWRESDDPRHNTPAAVREWPITINDPLTYFSTFYDDSQTVYIRRAHTHRHTYNTNIIVTPFYVTRVNARARPASS